MDNYFKTTKNNFMVPHSVWEDPKFQNLSSSCKFLYITLCKIANRNADDEGWFYHSISQLSDKSKMHRRTVISAKKKLKDVAFIDIRRGYMKHTKIRSYDYFRLNGFKFRGDK